MLYSYSKFPGRTGGRIFILCIISDEAEHMVEKREGEGRSALGYERRHPHEECHSSARLDAHMLTLCNAAHSIQDSDCGVGFGARRSRYSRCPGVHPATSQVCASKCPVIAQPQNCSRRALRMHPRIRDFKTVYQITLYTLNVLQFYFSKAEKRQHCSLKRKPDILHAFRSHFLLTKVEQNYLFKRMIRTKVVRWICRFVSDSPTC